VQLIVEFAKGLPAFIKIPQEDQITLLKVCYLSRKKNNEEKKSTVNPLCFSGLLQ